MVSMYDLLETVRGILQTESKIKLNFLTLLDVLKIRRTVCIFKDLTMWYDTDVDYLPTVSDNADDICVKNANFIKFMVGDLEEMRKLDADDIVDDNQCNFILNVTRYFAFVKGHIKLIDKENDEIKNGFTTVEKIIYQDVELELRLTHSKDSVIIHVNVLTKEFNTVPFIVTCALAQMYKLRASYLNLDIKVKTEINYDILILSLKDMLLLNKMYHYIGIPHAKICINKEADTDDELVPVANYVNKPLKFHYIAA